MYYRWTVDDNAYDCTMNSICPHDVAPQRRYTVGYHFVILDNPNNSTIEFTGVQDRPSKEVAGFEGIGKLLREIVIPSLTPIH